MRSFKQITNTPPRGSRWLYALVAMLATAANLAIFTVLFQSQLHFGYFVLLLPPALYFLVISFWIARTYAGYLAWLKASAVVVAVAVLSVLIMPLFFDWQTPVASPGALTSLWEFLPSSLLYAGCILVLMHVGFGFRRLPLLPKLVDGSPLTICRKCHYDLAGLAPSDRCPECGIETPASTVHPACRPRSIKAARLGRLFARPLLALLLLRFALMLVQAELGYQTTMAKYASLNPTKPELAHDFSFDLPNSHSGGAERIVLEGALVENPQLTPYALLVGQRTIYQDNGAGLTEDGLSITIVEVVENPNPFFGYSFVTIVSSWPQPSAITLSPEQSQAVLEHGIPDSLMAALAHRSTFFTQGQTSHSWMGSSSSGGGSGANTPPQINPGDHFPQSPDG